MSKKVATGWTWFLKLFDTKSHNIAAHRKSSYFVGHIPAQRPVRPAKTQFSRGIRPVRLESLLWRFMGSKTPNFLQADNEDADETGQMPRLICLRWAHGPFYWFLSCCSSFMFPDWASAGQHRTNIAMSITKRQQAIMVIDKTNQL